MIDNTLIAYMEEMLRQTPTDFVRYMADHIDTNYPKDETSGDALKDYPWSHRDFTYNEMKMDMPIPSDEIAKNPACTQNPAYTNNK